MYLIRLFATSLLRSFGKNKQMINFIDTYCFAGGFTVGAVQAGLQMIGKREGESAFGAAACSSNRHILGESWKLEACEPRFWSPLETQVILANPPCSGFSVRSVHVPPKGIDRKTTPISEWTNSFRGVDSSINSCMHDVIEYAAKCKELQIVCFESVAQAGKQGLPLMRDLRLKLESLTNIEWDLHHVFHNNLSVGGVCNRPRYFFVASRVPFGVLPARPLTPIPRSEDVLRGNGPGIDGNHTPGTMEARRTKSLLETGIGMAAREAISEPAGRFVEKYGIDALRKLDGWDSRRTTYFESRGWRKDQYQPMRWDADKPCPVITGKIQESLHPTEPRCLTFREAARVLGYPESWKLCDYKTDAWLGKGIPTGSGKWIAESIKLSLEGHASELEQGVSTGNREHTYDNTHEWKNHE